MRTLFYLLFITISFQCYAQELEIYPIPQKTNIEGEMSFPKKFRVQQKNTDKGAQLLIKQLFPEEKQSCRGIRVKIGKVNDRFVRKYKNKVPQKPEGYYLKIGKKEITIVGQDDRGIYYGLQTLSQLLNNKEKLPLVEITDYPDVMARGVVEGFYGTPWSFENRMRQLAFYGENKLNTYIYGPKDDPYHSSPNWRKPYPTEEKNQLKKLIDQAKINHVDFVWAIHPGKDIKWNEEDRNALIKKFELMYEMGVRSFAVFFDDISGEGTNPKQQASLLNYIQKQFIDVKKDVKPLIMCPTEYNKSWSNPKGGYLTTLGTELDPNIRIMWTGNRVIADIDMPTLEWINQKIRREAFIWWNFPVSDYVRNHLLLGPAYGNELNIANDLSGFVSNPMERAEASKIAIFSVADYTWNMKSYNDTKAWLKAMETVMPKSKDALRVFATHNSDLGPNGHGYRRNESVEFTPIAKEFTESLKQNKTPKNINAVKKEFESMVSSADILLNSNDNPFLMNEIRPWVQQFKLLGESGLEMIKMYYSLDKNQSNSFENEHKKFLSLKEKMFKIDQTENQNPYQPGIKTATLVVSPLINNSFSLLTERFNAKYNKNLNSGTEFNPHKLYTNIAQLASVPTILRNKELFMSPPLEVIKISPKEYFGFELAKTLKKSLLTFEFTPNSEIDKFKVEISKDGNTWTEVAVQKENSLNKATLDKEFKFVRIINFGNKEASIQIKKLNVSVK